MVVPKVDIFDLDSGGKMGGLVLELKGDGVGRSAVLQLHEPVVWLLMLLWLPSRACL
jgi:hypothetical protein